VSVKKDETFSAKETKSRMEAALRGARIAGHKPMTKKTKEKKKPGK
jgi:hypothetical protein